MKSQKTTDTLDGLLYHFIEGYMDAVNTEEYVDGFLEKAEEIPDVEPYKEFKKILLDIRNNQNSFIEQLESDYSKTENPQRALILDGLDKEIEKNVLQLKRNFEYFFSSSPDPLKFLEIEYSDVLHFINPHSDISIFASRTVLDFLKHINLKEIKRMSGLILYGLELKSLSNPLPRALTSYVIVRTLMEYKIFMDDKFNELEKEEEVEINKETSPVENPSAEILKLFMDDKNRFDKVLQLLVEHGFVEQTVDKNYIWKNSGKGYVIKFVAMVRKLEDLKVLNNNTSRAQFGKIFKIFFGFTSTSTKGFELEEQYKTDAYLDNFSFLDSIIDSNTPAKNGGL